MLGRSLSFEDLETWVGYAIVFMRVTTHLEETSVVQNNRWLKFVLG
jgi:hypothetical protein